MESIKITASDDESADENLIHRVLSGDKQALEILLEKHQVWVYNIALNLTANTDEAADLMQEVLIKVVTNLGKFEFRSEFRTWVYRIIKNHFLNTRRSSNENNVIPWDVFARGLDSIPDEPIADTYDVNRDLLIEEAKLSCMKAMLLCLSPEQRLIFVLGELFELPDSLVSEAMEISSANFRQKLSRARTQLNGFMNNQCGLINKSNPCRCARKTMGFIRKGYVDPDKLQFQRDAIAKIHQVAGEKVRLLDDEVTNGYKLLFQDHPFQQPPDRLESLRKLISLEVVKKTFDL